MGRRFGPRTIHGQSGQRAAAAPKAARPAQRQIRGRAARPDLLEQEEHDEQEQTEEVGDAEGAPHSRSSKRSQQTAREAPMSKGASSSRVEGLRGSDHEVRSPYPTGSDSRRLPLPRPAVRAPLAPRLCPVLAYAGAALGQGAAKRPRFYFYLFSQDVLFPRVPLR